VCTFYLSLELALELGEELVNQLYFEL